MISTEVLEQDELHSYKVIHYRNQNNLIIRRAFIDKDNHIVKDYLYERRPDGQISCIVLYGSDYISVLGIREIIYDNLDRRLENTQYKILNNNKIQIQKVKYYYEREDNLCNKAVFYGRNDDPVGYALYTYDDAGIAPISNYNMNHERVRRFNLEQIF